MFSVATVLTVYGIETENALRMTWAVNRLQQYLPFMVLKRIAEANVCCVIFDVATVLTACGIETTQTFCPLASRPQIVATAPTT